MASQDEPPETCASFDDGSDGSSTDNESRRDDSSIFSANSGVRPDSPSPSLSSNEQEHDHTQLSIAFDADGDEQDFTFYSRSNYTSQDEDDSESIYTNNTEMEEQAEGDDVYKESRPSRACAPDSMKPFFSRSFSLSFIS